ncbi:MAG: alpha/beta fold hydrolase [Maricaulaceae bacterium]|jgi:S-formylglutathione hydrolase FrmB
MKSAIAQAACAAALALTTVAAPALGQDDGATGTFETITVLGEHLVGNLEGDDPAREAVVYLPPSYATDTERRYPVLYNLHGYSIGAAYWAGALQLEAGANAAIAAGANEMIIVMPDAQTLHNGSMYSSSPTTGDWEAYIAEDLVAYMDETYRTIPTREARGLAGHSMGGYGTFRIAMKRPDVFSAFYAMSACCMSPRQAMGGEQAIALENIETKEEATELGFGGRATFSVAAAWSPNPDNPPFYADLPTEGGEVRDDVIAIWAANAPLAMVYQYVTNLKKYDAIMIDIGDQDGGLGDSQAMAEIFDRFGVEHTFEVYEGTHTSAVAERFREHVVPFFSEHLATE